MLAVSSSPGGVLRVAIDANLGGVEAVVAEGRLIGRASVARVAAAVLIDGMREWPLPHGLPGDLAVGDLLALPCRGAVSAGELGGAPGEAHGGVQQRDRSVAHVDAWLHALA